MDSYFDLKHSVSYKLYVRSKYVNSSLWRLLDILGWFIVTLTVLTVILELFDGTMAIYLSLSCFISLLWLWAGRFTRFQTLHKNLSGNNIADHLEDDAIEYLLVAEAQASKYNRHIDDGILWLAMLQTPAGRYLLIRAGLQNIDSYLSSIKEFWSSHGNEQVISDILILSMHALSATGSVELIDLLKTMATKSPLWKNIFATKKLDEKDIDNIVGWYGHYTALTIKKPFWEKEIVEGAVGRDWSFGYTPGLQMYARDLTNAVSMSRSITIYGRKEEVGQIEYILSRSSANNVILVGDDGVGKSTIVRSLAQKILSGRVNTTLLHKHIWQLDTGRLLAGAGEKGEVEARLKNVLDEAVSAGDIILFIDDIQSLLAARPKTGEVNGASLMLPYLNGSALQIIGATNLERYHADVEVNGSVATAFQKIEIKEPSEEDVIGVLGDSIPFYENHYGVVFTYPAVKEAVKASARYIHDKPFPIKTIQVVDNVALTSSNRGIKIITPEIVDAMVSEIADVPVGEASKTEKDRLINLESVIHRRVVGQNEAVTAVSSALKRARSGFFREHKPVGTFLFVGPTGVGKTETAKALAEAYFGSEERMIRLDMSEYQSADGVNKLIGSASQGGESGTQGTLTQAIKDNPFSVVLLDEIEKSNSAVMNLFLQILDDGRLTDGVGRTVDFSNAIVIATSNAGAEVIREAIQKQTSYETIKKNLLEFLQRNNIFKPEFLNRFDAVVAYRPLNMTELMQIIDIMISKVSASLKDKRIVINITPMAKQKLVQMGYDPVYGARPLWRTVQDKLENPLAEKLLKDEIQEGSTVTVDENDIV